MSDKIKIENGFGFKMSRNNKKLFVVYEPCDDKIDLTVDIFKERLAASPFATLFINDYSVSEFLRRYKNALNNESFECEIGERRDASFSIGISIDKMMALFSLTPNFGGKEITVADVQKLLDEKKIIWGVVPDTAIEKVLAKGRVSDFLIAEGLPPVPGIDAQFESLVKVYERKPSVDEHDNVDYRELGDIVTVHKNDVVMQRIPPIPGKKGCNVLGEIINPTGGLNIPFSADKKGVHLNSEDNNQLLSDISGQPVSVRNGMIVLPILTVKQVDFASGNIRFDGSVVVRGDVKEGMQIYALEDITIEGSVTNSQLECMGNLIVKGGVTGSSELLANGNITIHGGVQGNSEIFEAVDERYIPKVVSHGSIIVGFAENFSVRAGFDIVVEKYAMNSQLMAGNKIVTGLKNNAKKPSILGGVTWAMMLVKGTTIGSSSGIKTYVQVGSNPYIQKRETELKDLLALSEKEQEGIHKILAFIDTHPEKGKPEMLEKLHHTLSKLVVGAEMYNTELDELVANMTVIADAKVIAERGVYIGTEISINNVFWKAQENRGKSLFRVKDGNMIINTR